MFQTEGREIGMTLAQYLKLSHETRAYFRKMPAWKPRHTYHLHQPQASELWTGLWISRGGREPANVIKGERKHGGRKEGEATEGYSRGCSSCAWKYGLHLFYASHPRAGGGGGGGGRWMRWLTGKISPALAVWVLKAYFSNCSELSKVSVRSIGYCGICPDCWPIKM